MKRRFFVAVLAVLPLFTACGAVAAPVASPTIQHTATPLPPTATAVVAPTPLPTSTAPLGSADQPLRVRIIQSDTQSTAVVVDIISTAAAAAGIAVEVSSATADAAYALAQDPQLASSADAYLGTSYDIAQLLTIGAVAAGVPAAPASAYPFVQQTVQDAANQAVYPVAGRNYLIAMANADLLGVLPGSTDEWFQIDPNTTGRTRYDVAYAWAEGRWFDAFLAGLDPALSNPNHAPTADVLEQALTELQALRRLGPRDVTSYQEATVDFVNWRVPYTLDTDTAIRRYHTYSQTLSLTFAPPPIVSLSGQLLEPPIDTVALIGAAAQRPGAAPVVAQLAAALQQPATQLEFARSLSWIPIEPAVYSQIDITQNPEASVLLLRAPAYRAQRYDPTIICRWDAYEAVLPGVLLRENRVADVVEPLITAVTACQTP